MKKKESTDPAELEEMINRAEKAFATEEGKQKLREAFERGHVEALRLKEASIPTSRSLQRPITI
jgi:hypothetical protein